MSADLKTATSAPPRVLYSNYLPASETALYTATTGVAARLASVTLINGDTAVNQTASLSIVKTGDTAGGSNRVLPAISMAPYAVLDLGQFWLGEGDFLSGIAGTASKITVIVTGVEFTSTTVGTPTGINLDAVSAATGRGTSSPQATTITVGTGSNRYLIAALAVGHNGTITNETNYDTLTVSSSLDGALTKLVSARFDTTSNVRGTVHLFGRANPSSGLHTITGTAIKSALGIDTLQVAAESWTGVSGVSGATAFNNTSAAPLNVSLTSATGKRALFAAAFGGRGPSDVNRQVRYMNGPSSDLFGNADWLVMADGPGAATVALTTSDSQNNFAVGVNLDPA